jgi:tetratricopeptide (TPR) repeat protein
MKGNLRNGGIKMRLVARGTKFVAVTMMVIMVGIGVCHGQPFPGQTAPIFSLRDIVGRTHDLSAMKEQPMIILYFFDVESRPSQEGLLSLDRLAKQYGDADLVAWAITLSPKEKVTDFVARTNLGFPVLLDRSGASDLYQAGVVLPTICVLGPKLKVIDYLQGGGKSTEIMLVRLAERKLQQRQTRIAEAISEQVIKKDPKNLKARTVKGYAALKQGKLDEAEKTFRDLSKLEGQGEVLGKEGLARTYAKKGEAQKALAAATEVQELAPDRVYPHVVKGDVLSSQDKMTEAEAEYLKAAQKKTAEPYQRAPAYNQLGRLYATRGEYERSRELFDQAVAIDPYYIEATSNKGRTYEKEGKMDKALETYRQALTLDRNDLFASVLAKKAQEMLALQKDVEQKKRVDKLVKELADRYRTRKKSRLKTEDTWTSRPMVLSFVDFQEKGLPERDGLATVLIYKITDQLNASGRVQVVERVLIERLLEELNLGSSDLADPETALNLGRVLASKLIGTGSLFYNTKGSHQAVQCGGTGEKRTAPAQPGYSQDNHDEVSLVWLCDSGHRRSDHDQSRFKTRGGPWHKV